MTSSAIFYISSSIKPSNSSLFSTTCIKNSIPYVVLYVFNFIVAAAIDGKVMSY